MNIYTWFDATIQLIIGLLFVLAIVWIVMNKKAEDKIKL
jgi:hypothetical protein